MLRRSWLKGLAATFAGIAVHTVGRSSYSGGTLAASYKGGTLEPVVIEPPTTVTAEAALPEPAIAVEPEPPHHAPSPTVDWYERMRGDCPPRYVHHSEAGRRPDRIELLPSLALTVGVGNRREPANKKALLEAHDRYMSALAGFVPPPSRFESFRTYDQET